MIECLFDLFLIIAVLMTLSSFFLLFSKTGVGMMRFIRQDENFFPPYKYFFLTIFISCSAIALKNYFFGIGIIGLILDIIIYFGVLIVGVVRMPFNESYIDFAEDTSHGSARWGISNDLAESHFLDGSGTTLVGKYHKIENGLVRTNGHVVVVAPTGAGKGVGCVIPNLLTCDQSMIVLDLKGENYAVTHRQREAMGSEVFCVDPFNVCHGQGAGFNPLDTIDLLNYNCVADASVIAMMFITTENRNHWDESAQALILGLVLYVKTLSYERQNLGEVRAILTMNENAFLDVIADMAASRDAFGIIQRSANSFMSKPDKERASVLSTAQRYTAFLDDPRISSTLSRSDVDFSEIKEKFSTVYLVIPPQQLAVNTRFIRLFIGASFSALTSDAERRHHDRRVIFLLDEFAQLGYMGQVESAFSILRGYGIDIIIFLQDLSQLKAVYKQWQTFFANSSKVFFGVTDYDTAKYVSDNLGNSTLEVESTSSSTSDPFTTNTSKHGIARSLMTPDEIMRLGPKKPLFLPSGGLPYKLERINYLEDEAFRGLYDENPYHRK